MLQIIERLKQGDREIVDFFIAGEEKWKELLSDIREVGVEALGKRLQQSQYGFERLCSSREARQVSNGLERFRTLVLMLSRLRG